MEETEISRLRHEIGNLLSIAQATVEAMMDGTVEPSPQRLQGVRDAIVAAGEVLNGFTGR